MACGGHQDPIILRFVQNANTETAERRETMGQVLGQLGPDQGHQTYVSDVCNVEW